MKSLTELPIGYKEAFKIDLQRDTKQSLIVNVSAIIVSIVLAIIGHFIVPVRMLVDMSRGFKFGIIRLLALIIAIVLYLVLHELVHAVAMRAFGVQKVKFGFTGLYAFAGCDSYIYKRPYIVIALAPVIFWGLILLVINFFADASWFWVVYLIQITNVSGAAGDIYVSLKLSKMPEDTLVHDSGVAMNVYISE